MQFQPYNSRGKRGIVLWETQVISFGVSYVSRAEAKGGGLSSEGGEGRRRLALINDPVPPPSSSSSPRLRARRASFLPPFLLFLLRSPPPVWVGPTAGHLLSRKQKSFYDIQK